MIDLCERQFDFNFNDSDCLITIVIPTFNRKENLVKLLSFLNKNTNDNLCVFVVDNHSPYKLLKEDFEGICTSLKVRFFRNKIHLGPDASVLRALEIAESPWIYLLGDSKIPIIGFDQIIINDCLNNPEAFGIIYRFRNKLPANSTINQLIDLDKNLSDYGDIFLGGNSIISSKAVIKYFSIASMYTLSRMPHALFHLLSLNEKNKIYISNQAIISEFISKPNYYNPKLSLLECWAQFSLILSLPFKTNELKMLNRMILKMENIDTLFDFSKFCLIQIFRNKIDIRPHLKRILKYRYIYISLSFEHLIVSTLYIISLVTCPIVTNK
jgi:glycosyltransferase involved in cell wall biosynthesis